MVIVPARLGPSPGSEKSRAVRVQALRSAMVMNASNHRHAHLRN